MQTIDSRRRSSQVSSAGDKSSNAAPGIAEKYSPDSTPQKRKLRSNSAFKDSPDSVLSPVGFSPMKWKSPRRRLNDSPQINTTQKVSSIAQNYLIPGSFSSWNCFLYVFCFPFNSQENEKNLGNKVVTPIKSPVKKKLLDRFCDKPMWNPRGKSIFLRLDVHIVL